MVSLHSERDACHVPKYEMFQEAEADWKFTAVKARCMSLPWLWCFTSSTRAFIANLGNDMELIESPHIQLWVKLESAEILDG